MKGKYFLHQEEEKHLCLAKWSLCEWERTETIHRLFRRLFHVGEAAVEEVQNKSRSPRPCRLLCEAVSAFTCAQYPGFQSYPVFDHTLDVAFTWNLKNLVIHILVYLIITAKVVDRQTDRQCHCLSHAAKTF